MTNELKRETETFQRELPRLLADEGKFALVIGDDVVGTFDTYADAIQAGYARVGANPFLVKRVTQIEDSAYFSRPLRLCPASH